MTNNMDVALKIIKIDTYIPIVIYIDKNGNRIVKTTQFAYNNYGYKNLGIKEGDMVIFLDEINMEEELNGHK